LFLQRYKKSPFLRHFYLEDFSKTQQVDEIFAMVDFIFCFLLFRKYSRIVVHIIGVS